MPTLAAKVAERAHHQNLPARVASRYLQAKTSYKGKFLGANARLQWNDHTWVLEELPQKGKKKLNRAEMQNLYSIVGRTRAGGPMMPSQILREANLSSGDGYEKIKAKLEKAMLAAAEEVSKADPSLEWVARPGQVQWREEEVWYLNVIPEGVEPFTAMGKDFQVSVSWDDFSAMDPESDMQQADPYFNKVTPSSPQAARKLYVMLKADPDGLKSVPYTKFTDFLRANKIQYKTVGSSW